MAYALEQPRHRVADDRRAQVADVHLLRDVRPRVVDDDALGPVGARHAELQVGGERARLLLEEALREREVDEPRPRDFDALADVRHVELRDDGLRDLTGRALERLGEPHREVGLVVRPLGAANHRVRARELRTERGDDGRRQTLGQWQTGVGHESFSRRAGPIVSGRRAIWATAARPCDALRPLHKGRV